MRYFQLADDEELPGRWYLASPLTPDGQAFDPRVFTSARPVDVTGLLRLPLRRPGRSLDFTMADFAMPVARRSLAEQMDRLAPGALQRVPVAVEGTAAGDYEIITMLREVACVDEAETHVVRWTPEMGLPDMVGKYLYLANIVIDPAKTNGAALFRLAGWKAAIVCTETVKPGLEAHPWTGLRFLPLGTSPSQPAA
jgi:hypothetical protein